MVQDAAAVFRRMKKEIPILYMSEKKYVILIVSLYFRACKYTGNNAQFFVIFCLRITNKGLTMKFADGDGYLDVIIYIIIMVVGLAASAFRNFSKRKQMEQQKEQGDAFPGFPVFEEEAPEIEEEYYEEEPEYADTPYSPQSTPETQGIPGMDQSIVPEPTVQPVSSESLIDRPVSEVESVISIDMAEKSSTEFVHDDISIKPYNQLDEILSEDLSKSEIHDALPEEEELQEFDAKRAIIYAEIINRKYN